MKFFGFRFLAAKDELEQSEQVDDVEYVNPTTTLGMSEGGLFIGVQTVYSVGWILDIQHAADINDHPPGLPLDHDDPDLAVLEIGRDDLRPRSPSWFLDRLPSAPPSPSSR
jgi:hypothetical protein